MLNTRKTESFGDGILTVCQCQNRTITGTKGTLRFGKRMVGVTRFYRAKVASSNLSKLVAVPYCDMVCQTDIVLIGDDQYRISQIQEKLDTFPPCLYLALEKIVIKNKRSEKDESFEELYIPRDYGHSGR